MATARPIALTQFAFVALSYAALTYAHVVSDFSLANVVENSHSTKPLIYKISGVWGNHEGSMMLWVLILTLCGAAMAAFSRAIPPRLLADALSVQGVLGAAFLLFILLTSNPFARLSPAPIEGADLNPILQDPGLAIHPPLLYLGYVGFSIVFSLAAAALIGGRIDAAFARVVRPWTLAAWCFLTLGIAMGSYWAYYTLGWGGFWFWDPVENASLLPWLVRHGFAAFGGGDGKARGAEDLDDLPRDPDLLAVAARHVPGALGRADLGSRLRQRSAARPVHPGHSRAVHRRRPVPVHAARLGAETGRPVRADLARRRAGAEQPAADGGLRGGLRRHALSAGAGSLQRRQDFRRRAVLQPDLRAVVRAAAAAGAARAAAGLEARRPARGGAAADLRRLVRPCRPAGVRGGQRQAGGGLHRSGRRRLSDHRRLRRDFRAHLRFRVRRDEKRLFPRARGCRFRSGAPLSPMPASASPCSASPRPAGASRRSSR